MVQKLLRGVLTASVWVEDRHPFLDRAPACRHVNGLAHQGGTHMISHRITHDFLGAAVQNSREINDAGPCADVGDITAQLLAGPVSGGSPA